MADAALVPTLDKAQVVKILQETDLPVLLKASACAFISAMPQAQFEAFVSSMFGVAANISQGKDDAAIEGIKAIGLSGEAAQQVLGMIIPHVRNKSSD